ncbi:hypothetical protein TRFO_19072 [Tritrichomonas foetus]|uniref:Uncharacterized protein n=1 Tax=Tritrichomonas foetus TaxID=1144522 RepID=A0A1J4KJC8_9EUKA|nr:hypothetical protein TRFO_19072 [Tritrichomonas foetus]|eukprot:OHT11441.1 hypothetical protein TRFO_19072 [Tritrichomonas foetus]
MDFIKEYLEEFEFSEFVSEVASNFDLHGFLSGLTFGLIFLLITKIFISKLPKILMIIIPLIPGLALSFSKVDTSQALNFLDIPISITAAYLYVRFSMSTSRSFLIVLKQDSSKFQEVIIVTSFLIVCLTGFILYNCFEKSNEAYAVYGLSAITFIITLICDNGIILDPCLISLQSITCYSTSYDLSTFISVLRLSLVLISYVSVLFKFPSYEKEDLFIFFKLKKKSTRIIFALVMIFYFYISPSNMWKNGKNEHVLMQCYSVPILYIVFMIYEKFNLDDPMFYGYST